MFPPVQPAFHSGAISIGVDLLFCLPVTHRDLLLPRQPRLEMNYVAVAHQVLLTFQP